MVYLNEKLRTNPKHSFLYVDKALFLQLDNDLENALKTSSQALALRKSAYAYYRKASIEFDLGLFDDVKSDCTEAIKLLPGTKAFHLLRLAACQSYISPSNEEPEKIDELALLALLKADITNRENAVKNDKLTISFGTGAFDERNPEEPYCLFLYDSPCMKEDGSMLFSKVKD